MIVSPRLRAYGNRRPAPVLWQAVTRQSFLRYRSPRPRSRRRNGQMPVVLSQRTWHADPKYFDREGVIYHYPRQYRGRNSDFDRFIYYRPAAGAAPEEQSTYVGHGILGISVEDWARAGHWFVHVPWYEPFGRPVGLRQNDTFVETESVTSPQFQSAARPIRETAFYRILSLGGVSAGREFAPPVTTVRC